MTKLNQIVAVVNGKKTETKKAITDLHRQSQTTDLFSGLSRVYKPHDDDGEQLPSEGKMVQFTVASVLETVENIWSDSLDLVATQDYNNCTAVADVVVDGQVIIHHVPVTFLMYLEKQLLDIEKFVLSLLTLDPSTSKYNAPQVPVQFRLGQLTQPRQLAFDKLLTDGIIAVR